MFRLCPRLTIAFATLLFLAPASPARDPQRLRILEDNYPRVFFFRASEQAFSERRYPTYASWEQQFNRLQGIMGKCLDEECIGREARNPEFFSRFKQDHPEQVVLLHFNGNARDPRYHTEEYFPGHWIYRRATLLTRDLPADPQATTIHVEDASDFRVNTGRYRTSNDDLALFGITAEERHDWSHCEQVRLVSVDRKANTIEVQRGCYGTRPLAFTAGAARAAAHQVEGPWGRTNNLMWYYNFSSQCPKDQNGKTCADHLVDDLAAWFGPDGKLAAFDGLEFDVMFNQTHGDTDGDGREDDGVVDGVNCYGVGVVRFARQLRARMGDNFIIQGDGALGSGGVRSQRAWGLLNGIESEGWPNLGDWEIEDWSGGMNRHFFWQANGRQPVFNYVNHKWTTSVPGQPGARQNPQVPFSRHRLVFAVCQFFDAMTCYSYAPPRDPGGKFGVWDEFRQGIDNRLGWLGRPEGPAVRLAAGAPNLLADCREPSDLAARVSGPVRTSVTPQGVRIAARDPAAEDLRFAIREIPADGKDLYVTLEMTAEPVPGHPPEMARFAQVGVSGGMIDLMAAPPLVTGIKLRGAAEEGPLDQARGASFLRRSTTIDGTTLPAYFVHPPYKNGTGSTFWTQEVDVPETYELRFSTGMGELSPERSDGVCFEVHAAKVDDGTVGPYEKLFEATSKAHQWLAQTVALDDLSGNRVRFKFVADCGPQDNATTDHAYWGNVRLVRSGTDDRQITEARQHMTWVNDRLFTSTFYYRHVQSETVNLSVTVEGSPPVTIRCVTAHAHPDAIYREFENGLVLANPSHRPSTFDLQRLTPGRRYRRLQATPAQDVETNNGQPVGSTVTLGERDALFLLRTD